MSCWIRPAGAHSYLEFLDDRPQQPGWDMIVLVEGQGVHPQQSWRGDNALFPISLEEAAGTDLGGAPVVVRFQGARSASPTDLCDVELHGPGAEIVPGSLTPWVVHPAELNAFTADPAKKPDMIRFQVIFDRSQGALSEAISAVDDLGVLARPMP